MNSVAIREAKYRKFGLNDFRFRTVEDIANVLDVYANEIAGYDKLSLENREIFEEFIVNFYNGFGLEKRVDIIPTKIYLVDSEKEDEEIKEIGLYLKFDFIELNNDGTIHNGWLHVFNPTRYY